MIRTLALAAALAAAEPAFAQDVAAPASIDAAIEVRPGFATIAAGTACTDETDPAAPKLFLTVDNKGAEPLVLANVMLLAPADLMLCAPRTGIVVPAHRRVVIPIAVGVGERPRDGAAPLLLQVTLDREGAAAGEADQVIVSSTVDVRIAGVSDILKLIGIPALFLLPGILVLGAFAMWRPKDKRSDWLSFATLSFWIISVPVSMLMSWGYAGLMSALGYSRDLVERFNLLDVTYVWVAAIALGSVIAWVVNALEDDHRKKRSFSASDTPIKVLEKLKRIGGAFPPPWNNTSGEQGFIHDIPGSDHAWIIPQARLSKPPDANTKPVHDEIAQAQESAPSAGALLQIVRSERFRRVLSIRWDGDGKPKSVSSATLERDGTQHDFISQAPG